jgi:dTDP-glucose pyrophosphorylase
MTRSDLTLVVLAAGIGSRYGGLKQMDPIGPSGELIIDYSVYDALRAGFSRVVFVISEAIAEPFRERVGKTIERHCETAYVFQRLDDLPNGLQVPAGRKKPWGTAHAILCSRSAVSGPFAAINADDFYGRSAYQALYDYLRDIPGGGMPQYCMVGYRLGNTLTEHGSVARGICAVDEAGCLLDVQERMRIERAADAARYTEDGERWVTVPLDTTVSMNMWGFTPAVYSDLEERFVRFLVENQAHIDRAEYFIPTVVATLVHERKAQVKVLTTGETWYGVTYAADKPRVKEAIQEMVRAGLYPPNLWQGPV